MINTITLKNDRTKQECSDIVDSFLNAAASAGITGLTKEESEYGYLISWDDNPGSGISIDLGTYVRSYVGSSTPVSHTVQNASLYYAVGDGTIAIGIDNDGKPQLVHIYATLTDGENEYKSYINAAPTATSTVNVQYSTRGKTASMSLINSNALGVNAVSLCRPIFDALSDFGLLYATKGLYLSFYGPSVAQKSQSIEIGIGDDTYVFTGGAPRFFVKELAQ